MIKLKSKSKEPKDIIDYVRHVAKTSSPFKEPRMLRTAEYRNRSNEFVPHGRSNECNSIKQREFSTSKGQRKESRQP
jgi:hypothetical protein